MNVIILTPDRVGSTLLQRLITVYAHVNYNEPLTINLHELTNGLVSYDNEFLGKRVLGKKSGGWGYHQSLSEIVSLIDNCGHDVVSRLAHYHIKNRKDSQRDQLSFYQWINENFFIIAARRRNLLEHAMSWAIAVESKKLNVYSSREKFEVFQKITSNGIVVQSDVLEKYLNQYEQYWNWVDDHFQVNAYFEYERDLPQIEDFILQLSVFGGGKDLIKWKDRFEMSWNDWNNMHYLLSLVPFDHHFSREEKQFMQQWIDTYTICRVYLQDLQDQGILVSGIPIKLHTLQDKTKIITNASQCLLEYNRWASAKNLPYALTHNPSDITQSAMIEHNNWNTGRERSRLSTSDIDQTRLLSSDLR